MGEKAKRIGEEAENKVWNFLTSLGYSIDETNNEKYNIDCIAISPKIKTHYGLCKPIFSPRGRIAFEVRQPSITITKIKKFKQKIDVYNTNEEEKIDGGIYIVDKKVTQSMNKKSLENGIHSWGIKRQRLYVEKIKILNDCKEKNINILESTVDNTNSYICCINTPPTSYEHLIKLYLFNDDPYNKYTPIKMEKTLSKIKQDKLDILLSIGIKPINLYFESHSIGGVSQGLENRIKKISEDWNAEDLFIYRGELPFRDYRAFSTL